MLCRRVGVFQNKTRDLTLKGIQSSGTLGGTHGGLSLWNLTGCAACVGSAPCGPSRQGSRCTLATAWRGWVNTDLRAFVLCNRPLPSLLTHSARAISQSPKSIATSVIPHSSRHVLSIERVHGVPATGGEDECRGCSGASQNSGSSSDTNAVCGS